MSDHLDNGNKNNMGSDDEAWLLKRKKRPRGPATSAARVALEPAVSIKSTPSEPAKRPKPEIVESEKAPPTAKPLKAEKGDSTSLKRTNKVYQGIPTAHKGERPSSAKHTLGPDNAKPTCRFDFAKDLCKDYNESGYCVFGDTCIFLHDRGDYKSGWELELEWNEKQNCKQTEQPAGTVKNDLSDDECSACNETELNAPVLAECGHKYCEACALKEFASSKRCVKCGKAWNGSFKVAHSRRE